MLMLWCWYVDVVMLMLSGDREARLLFTTCSERENKHGTVVAWEAKIRRPAWQRSHVMVTTHFRHPCNGHKSISGSALKKSVTGLDGSTYDWLFAAMRVTSCSPSSVTIFVGLLFLTIHLARALVIASNLPCAIGLAFPSSSASVDRLRHGLPFLSADGRMISIYLAVNGCLFCKRYVKDDVLRRYLNSHRHKFQATKAFVSNVNLPPTIDLPTLLVAIVSF